MNDRNIPEAFFHFLWKYRLISLNLLTTENEEIRILNPGNHNRDAGPDFLFARVKIGNTLWAGNVEIHVRASEWYRHGHHKDPVYNNVVLHVVAIDDAVSINQAGREIPALCLADKFDEKLLTRYHEISANLLWVPCMKMLYKVKGIYIISCIHAHAIGRLKQKSQEVENELMKSGMDWDECCYRLISGQFGIKVNTANFEMLARSIPARVLMKYHADLFSLEALLFGQSGLLCRRLREAYPRDLKAEHTYLAAKHKLTPMPGYLWNFLRLRPAGFPTIRIAHLAKLYEQHQRLFQAIIDSKDLHELEQLFNVCASGYWDDHYIFGKRSGARKKCFGKQSIHLLLINAIIPMIYHYGDVMQRPALCNRAVSFLEQLPAEDNAEIRRWKNMGVSPLNSLESQGLIQLKRVSCDNKLCLECGIGFQILKNND